MPPFFMGHTCILAFLNSFPFFFAILQKFLIIKLLLYDEWYEMGPF